MDGINVLTKTNAIRGKMSQIFTTPSPTDIKSELNTWEMVGGRGGVEGRVT